MTTSSLSSSSEKIVLPARAIAGVVRLARIALPQHLAGLEIEREVLPAVQMGQAEKHTVDRDGVAHVRRDFIGVPDVCRRPLVAAGRHAKRSHAIAASHLDHHVLE